MKLALAALLCLALAMAALPGLAEATEDGAFHEDSAPYQGQWVPFEDGFRLYVPAQWQARSLTEAQSAAGLFYMMTNGGSDEAVGEVPMGLAVGYLDVGSMDDLNPLARDFERSGHTDVHRLDLNGIPALSFRRVESNYRGVAFFHPSYPGYALLVYVTPCAAPGSAADGVASALLASVSPAGD